MERDVVFRRREAVCSAPALPTARRRRTANSFPAEKRLCPVACMPAAWVYCYCHELLGAGALPPHPADLKVTAPSTAQDGRQQELIIQAAVPAGTASILKCRISLIPSRLICIPKLVVQDAHLQQKP